MTRRAERKGDREKRELLERVLSQEIARADGGESDELMANRALALAYYQGRPNGEEVKDRSGAISTDVADMINATLALMVPMISTDAVVLFEPEGAEDDAQAAAESQAVNRVIIEENDGFIAIQEAVKDALLMRNGCMKVRAEDFDTVETFSLPDGLAPEQLAALREPRSLGEVREIRGNELTVTRRRRRFVVSAVPIENISYQSGYSGPLQRIRYFGERLKFTRSELIELGFDRVLIDELPAYDELSNEVDRLRDANQEPGPTAETRDQDTIECHECYQLIDLDGDGISERYRVLIAGRNQVLDYEPVTLVPYALGSPFLNPHRLTGESLFDHLKATQDVKTKLLRQFLDNVAICNNGRYAYDPNMTVEEDVLNPTAGGGIRARNPGQSIVPIATPDVTAGILAALTYEDQRRTERGGAALEMLSADRQLMGETAHGIERQYAAREAMVSMMAKNLAETLIRGIYVLTHAFMRAFGDPVPVVISGSAQMTDPSSWPERVRVNVTTGLSPGQRGHIQQVLATTMQIQANLLQTGANGVLVDAQTIYRTAQAWLRIAGVDNPERLWIDPSSPPARQAMQGQSQSGQAAQKRQDDIIKAQLEIEREKIRSSDRQHEGDLKFKYYDADLDADVEEAKLTVGGVIDLEKQRMSNHAAVRSAEARGSSAGAEGNSGRGRA